MYIEELFLKSNKKKPDGKQVALDGSSVTKLVFQETLTGEKFVVSITDLEDLIRKRTREIEAKPQEQGLPAESMEAWTPHKRFPKTRRTR